MKSADHHVPDDVLTAFVEGEVGDQVAVHVATHLDGCPACATRAAAIEPLAVAFASTEDPVAPPELAAAALAAASIPERGPGIELAVGSLLLFTAACLAVANGPPTEAVLLVGRSLDALARLSDHVTSLTPTEAILWCAVATTLAGVFAVYRTDLRTIDAAERPGRPL